MELGNSKPAGGAGSAATYGQVVRELGSGVKHFAESEARLIRAELKDTAQHLGRHSAQAAIFGALLAMSVLPALAFLVIGLGELLNGNYWLSSLIVAVVTATIGGVFAYRAYKEIKGDLGMPLTSHSLKEVKETMASGAENIKDKIKHPTASPHLESQRRTV